jgi:hypothetical protein
MTTRRKLSRSPKNRKKNIWVRHPSKEMDDTWLCMFSNSLGMVTQEKQRSEKDKLLRNRYMGVWRWDSNRMRTMMMRFSSTVVRYMARNRT